MRLAPKTLGLLVLSGTLACGEGPSPSDLVAIENARNVFAGIFEIEPKRSIYIEVKYLESRCPRETDAIPLYEALFLDTAGSWRSDTRFVYLNLRDRSGDFCYQLYYDEHTKKFEQSAQAYY